MTLFGKWFKSIEIKLHSPHLPALGVLPVQVQTIEVVLLDEFDDVGVEFGPGAGAVDEPAVLVPLRVVPATNGESNFLALLLVVRNLRVEVCKGRNIVLDLRKRNNLLFFRLRFAKKYAHAKDYCITGCANLISCAVGLR